MFTFAKCTIFILALALHQHHVDGSKPADAVAAAAAAAAVADTAPHRNISNVDNRRSGYLPPSSLVNVDADKEAAHFAAHTTGFVPIAKPIGHDLFEASASERNNIQHQPKFQQSQPQNSFNATADDYDSSNYGNGNRDGFPRYPTSYESSYVNGPSMDQYYDETQNRPETSDRNANNNNYNQVSMFDSEISKFLNEKYNNEDNNKNENVNEPDGYSNNNNNNNHHNSHKSYGKQYKPHSTYNDESSMINPASAINMMKNMPQYSSNDNSQNEPDIQSILSQFNGAGMDHQGNGGSKLSNAEFASANDFGTFGSETLNAPSHDINGLAGFQPAPEGGQLPAPPGYKHVGYITIPAGAANLPNMMAAPGSGLPIIRPIPIHGGEMGGMNKMKLDSKKNQDNKMSESKPVRSFLSRLNPLNMLKRLRQRRERRQTTDMSTSDYMTVPSKYASGYGYTGSSMPSSYSMTPYTGYSSLSGLGGMSGVGGMYPSGAASASMYAMPSYGSAYPYAGYSSYGSPASYGSYMSPASYISQADPKGSSGGSEMTASASAIAPSGMAMAPQGMGMPMMIPMSNYGGYGYGGMTPMGSYPTPMHAPMPYGYGHMHAPHYHSPSSSASGGPSSSAGGSSNDQQSLSQTQLPGGINLSDLLKDEEDEPSKFRKFLGYMNPMNIFKRFRNNTSDDQKRLGRYRRDVAASSLYDIGSANDTELSDVQDLSESDDVNNSSSLATATDPMEEEMSAEFTSHKAVHNYRKSGGKRTKASLMGSRNFEVLGGGTFPNGQHVPLQSNYAYSIDDGGSSSEISTSSLAAGDIENSFGKPSLHGFQGFDSFTSHHNTLTAGTDRLPSFVEQVEGNAKGGGDGGGGAGDEGKGFRSIERASITETELNADA